MLERDPSTGMRDPRRRLFARRASVAGLAVMVGGSLLVASTDAPKEAGADDREVHSPVVDAASPSFDREVRPILSDHCFLCHGPDAGTRKADLRLDLREDAIRDREGVRAIDLGDPGASEILVRIESDDPEMLMPPPAAHKPLSERERSVLRRWIEAGAPYEAHWSFATPRAVEPPLPSGADAGEANPIDAFVRASLGQDGLSPAPEADPVTLLRRVSLDLTGLPPSLEELAAHEAQVRLVGPDAAHRAAVDRLLASERFGEHWAREWLDAVRYADTHGLHFDNERVMWPYRDWVVRALNENKPFDEFSIEQIAGDLLPGATLDQQVATGFVRCHVTTGEGGSIDEEYFVKYAVDRTETFATIWLGLTAGCAACHDHKYDPISQREFYALYAFFNNTTEAAMDGNLRDAPPAVKVPSPAQRVDLAAVDARLSALRAQRDREDPAVDAEQAAWAATRHGDLASRWRPLEPDEVRASSGATFARLGQGVVLASDAGAAKDRYLWQGRVPSDLDAAIGAIRLDLLEHGSLPFNGPGGGPTNGNFVLSEIEVSVAPPGADPADDAAFVRVPIASALATYEQPGFPVAEAIDGILEGDAAAENGWAGLRDGDVGARSAVFVLADPAAVVPGSTLRMALHHGSIHHAHQIRCFRVVGAVDPQGLPAVWSPWEVAGPIDLASREEATSGAIDPASVAWSVRSDLVDGRVHPLPGGTNRVHVLRRRVRSPEPRRLVLGIGSDDAVRVSLDGVVVHDNPTARSAALDQDRVAIDLPEGEHELLLRVIDFGGDGGVAFRVIEESLGPEPLEVAMALALDPESRSEAERALLRRHFREATWAEGVALGVPIAEADAARTAMLTSFPTSLVAAERMPLRPAHRLERGEYDKPREVVERGVPAMLPPLDPDLPRDRLGLARWLFAPGHPLVARVTVNRIWARYFGTGLVETVEDFGSQGARPSHPELLDFLAVEFERSGWDVKALHRLIVTSATYRQDSAADAAAWAEDPENRRLARGPRLRLEAESIRDLALFASGLLVERVGGPPVKPYQPPGLWEVVAYPTSNTARFVRDSGDALWRRSLYTFWKRTSPPPAMTTLDAPSREACVVARETTNTPLAALVLLNDEQFVEAARHLGARMREAGGDAAAIDRGFRIVLSRPPEQAELAAVRLLLDEARARFAAEPRAAVELLDVGESPIVFDADPREQAAFTVIGSVLLNLDEAITKG